MEFLRQSSFCHCLKLSGCKLLFRVVLDHSSFSPSSALSSCVSQFYRKNEKDKEIEKKIGLPTGELQWFFFDKESDEMPMRIPRLFQFGDYVWTRFGSRILELILGVLLNYLGQKSMATSIGESCNNVLELNQRCAMKAWSFDLRFRQTD
ncbi:unnamed protein product [Vicia faba]|uniref:Uncharacterized protein n=1 Tax=Vicia faba TaxID=3906 RepID=A0AAV1AU58_VICFA|nr:unnamed protein product [Vicia faba]